MDIRSPGSTGGTSVASGLTLSAYSPASADVQAYTPIPWTFDIANGDDITIDGTDPSIIHLAAGKAYVCQVQGNYTGGDGTKMKMNWNASPSGEDGGFTGYSDRTDIGMVFMFIAQEGCTLSLYFEAPDSTTGTETWHGGGIDIASLG